MMERGYCYKDVLPFTAMAAFQCTNVGLNIVFKAATLKGMSYYIFITYSFVLGTILLLPLSFLFPRSCLNFLPYDRYDHLIHKSMLSNLDDSSMFASDVCRAAILPPLKFHILSRLFLLGLIGFLAQICAYKGIEYSSPTLASALSNLTPAFTFILAVLFRFNEIWKLSLSLVFFLLLFFLTSLTRFERIALRSSNSQAKILGTIASILGALLVVLYKGPKVFSSPTWTSSSTVLHQLPLESSSESNWVFGGILLASAYFLFAYWNIIQAQVMQMYPVELMVSFFFNLFAAIVSIPVSLLAESNLSSWRLSPSVAVIAFLYSGVFSSIGTIVYSWCLHLKGPVYVAIFSPLSIAIAAFMSAIFLGDSLYLGSIVGAIIISMGFYAVIWGKAKEERIEDDSAITNLEPSSSGKVPLLQKA